MKEFCLQSFSDYNQFSGRLTTLFPVDVCSVWRTSALIEPTSLEHQQSCTSSSKLSKEIFSAVKAKVASYQHAFACDNFCNK